VSGTGAEGRARGPLTRARPCPPPPEVTSPVPRAVWEAALRSDGHAVVSQSLAWRDAVLADGRYQDVSLLYEFPSGRQVVLPMARHRRRPPLATVTASWPGGWGVGGPISLGGRVSPAEAGAVLADVARRGTLAAEIQFRHEADEAWLRETGRFRAERRGCHILDLDGGFGRVWQHRFRGTARTAVRKAERSGLDVEVDRSGRLLPVFNELYEKSIQRWAAMQHEPLWLSRWRTIQATPPRMLEVVAGRFGTDCGIWVAWSRGVPVAAIIVLKSGGYAKYWRGAMDKELATGARANDLLHRLAIEDACEEGYRWYDMGYSRPGSRLASFKEKLGATLYFCHTLRAERLPMHAAGQFSRDLAKRVMGFRDA
jgi:Acetyltransferase (GNAT) domain